ncbi:IPT/TIG domain-containing protein [Promicromonospora sp. NFX87]|uniref:IPT/TIG domain-containing protein n=1 Tax=Promicromonospora sp. NFX87 TaxID=3402691 RepID=UPI003AFB3039
MPLPSSLPAGYSLVSDFEWGLDIDLTDTDVTPTWQAHRLLTSMTPTPTQVTRDEGTFDDEGNPNQGVVGVGVALAATSRLATALGTGLYLPEVEVLDIKSRQASPFNAAHCRWYHKPKQPGVTPHPVAFEGWVSVAQTPPTTGIVGATSDVTHTLTSKGKILEIANPYTGAAVAQDPIIAAISPAGRAVGEIITINGSNFTAAATVTIDGIALAPEEINYVGPNQLVVVIPVAAAGASPVIVTTTAGASNAVQYTVAA